MTRRIIYFILLTCFLSACQSDYSEYGLGLDDKDELLSLSVFTSECEVVDGTGSSRAIQNGPSTTFEEGERVGLIILDSEGNFLAENVPYKFDGKKWLFDADNSEDKELIYFDSTMSTCIVYYPYDRSVDGIKNESDLKNLKVFARRENQSTKDAYIFSDLLIWSYSGNAIKEISANLKHVHKSISLDLKLRWDLELPDRSTLLYHPLKEALEEFRIVYEDGTPILNDDIDFTYWAEDATYRYILPDDYDGTISWRYIYRGESYDGECKISSQAAGVRYV